MVDNRGKKIQVKGEKQRSDEGQTKIRRRTDREQTGEKAEGKEKKEEIE